MDLPKEFIEKMHKLLGDEAEDFFSSLEKPSQKGITLNTSRMSKDIFEKEFQEPISPIEKVSNGYYVGSFKFGENIFNHLGVIYSQEPSAMYPVELLDVKEGDIVLDLCASPGGKSIQILEKLNNTGLLISNEIVFSRAKILEENISKMGFQNEIITCNSPKDFENTNLVFDKILVDAPCGGEGMIRKNNFDISFYNPDSIETNRIRQLSILTSIKDLLKVGGTLVYSTCTYDTRENEEVIAKFLSQNPEFEIMEKSEFDDVMEKGIKIENLKTELCFRRYPHKHKGEGQFMVALKKVQGDISDATKFKSTICNNFSTINSKELGIIKSTLKDVIDLTNFEYLKRNDFVYVIPKEKANLKGLNVLTFGCLLGQIQKDFLKISHEFYHTFGNFFKNKINLNIADAKKYLHGEELEIDLKNGVYAITHLGIALGGGKIVNGRLKNYYKKNSRI